MDGTYLVYVLEFIHGNAAGFRSQLFQRTQPPLKLVHQVCHDPLGLNHEGEGDREWRGKDSKKFYIHTILHTSYSLEPELDSDSLAAERETLESLSTP